VVLDVLENHGAIRRFRKIAFGLLGPEGEGVV